MITMAALLAALSLSAGAPTTCATPTNDPYLRMATAYFHLADHRVVLDVWVCRALLDGRNRRPRRLLEIGNPSDQALDQALYVFAHERAHAKGELNECETDRQALRSLPWLAPRIGFSREAGVRAQRSAAPYYLSGDC